jgi:hypothetical protein
MVLANQPSSAKPIEPAKRPNDGQRATALNPALGLAFEDYLSYEPDEERRYELADGKLVSIGL